MNQTSKDEGVIQVVLDDFENHTLPRIIRIKERVDAGATLTDSEIAFLEDALERAKEREALAAKREATAAKQKAPAAKGKPAAKKKAPKTPAAVQKSMTEKMIDNLDWIHRRT